jgi:predicted protein tyrosine phosphatase
MEEIKLIVLSRTEAQEYTPAEPTAYVSIYTPGDMPAGFPHHPNICGVIKLAFPDLNIDEHPRLEPILFNADQAKAIKDFVQAAYDRGIRHFLIHCDAGISRSCGVASALDVVFNKATALRPRYCMRNSMVEAKMLEAFLGPMVDKGDK